MEKNRKITREEFESRLDEVIKEIRVKALEIKEESFREFCELTGHDFDKYKALDRAPEGYLMTFTDPAVSEMFVKFFLKHPKTIKGVIHTTSTVEIFHEIKLSEKNFTEKLSLINVEEKSGSRGTYYAATFEVELNDKDGKKSRQTCISSF